MIDYQEIVDNLTDKDIERILRHLGIEYEDRGSYFLMPTYCHNHMDEEASLKLYYYKNNKVFMCYTECGGMSIFKFLKNFYDAQGIEYDWYNDIYKLILGNAELHGFIATDKYHSLIDKYAEVKKDIKLPVYNDNVLDCFVKTYPPEWLNDGISKEAMDKYNIRYSISQNKIIIPHYNVNGELVGIRGRALNEYEIENYGKYAPIYMEGQWYSHPLSMNVYGLNNNKDNISRSRICYVAEGEKSVLQAESFDGDNCVVAACGSNFNKFALNIILKACNPQEVVICFDKEEEYPNDKYFNKLYKLCQKYNNYCEMSFIYDRENLLKLKESPFDKGEEIFKKLVKRRIRVR